MPTIHTALVSESDAVPFSLVAKIAAALQRQLTEDFTPIWNIPATVGAFEKLSDVPPDYWPIKIVDEIGEAGHGFHRDEEGRPFALVKAHVVHECLAVVCSHELLEMLSDPTGGLLIAAKSPMDHNEDVQVLMEICDPCQDFVNGYNVNGLRVSSFCTPRYYDPSRTEYPQSIFKKNGTVSMELLDGGYITYQRPDGTWWQADRFGLRKTTTRMNLTPRPGQTLREAVDALSFAAIEEARENEPPETRDAGHHARDAARALFHELEKAAHDRAEKLNAWIQWLKHGSH